MSERGPWDELNELVGLLRGNLDRALAEAQKRFETATDEMLPLHVRTRIAQAAAQRMWLESLLAGRAPCDWVLVPTATGATPSDWLASCGSDWFGAALELRADERLMIDIDSTSVELDALCQSRFRSDAAHALEEPQVSLHILPYSWENVPVAADRRDLAVRWVCLDVPSTHYPEGELAVSTSFDFADYDDEVVRELLRN